LGKLPLLGYLKNKISPVILTNDYRETLSPCFFPEQLSAERICRLLQKEEGLLQEL
jgi:hypothetical protein